MFVDTKGNVLLNEVDYVWQYVTARAWFGWIATDQIATIWARCWLRAAEDGARVAVAAPGGVPGQPLGHPESLVHCGGDGPLDGYTQLSVGGDAVALESVGPLVVGVDGSLSRIQNWSLMNQTERDAAFRLLGKRNKARLSKLRQEQPDSEDSRE